MISKFWSGLPPLIYNSAVPPKPWCMPGRSWRALNISTSPIVGRVEICFGEKEANKIQKKLRSNEFTLEDFRDQLLSMRKMGSIKDMIGMIPGMGNSQMNETNIDERKFRDIVKKLTSQGARPKYADTQLTGDVPIQEEMKLLNILKSNTIQVKMVSSADTGYFYVKFKNPKTKTEKLELKKYDPKVRKHVIFKEQKIK